MQPDTIIPDLSNPQGWNRYSYVSGNPINLNDPTGHQEVSGCSELAGGCNITQKVIDDDAQKLALLEKEASKRKCEAGNENYCPTIQTHPGEVIVFGVTGLVGGAALEAFILGGGAVSALEAASGLAYKGAVKAITACLMSSLC